MKNAFALLLFLCIILMTIVRNIVRVNVLPNLARVHRMKQAVNMVQAQPLTGAAVRAFTAKLTPVQVSAAALMLIVQAVLVIVTPVTPVMLIPVVLKNRHVRQILVPDIPYLLVRAGLHALPAQ